MPDMCLHLYLEVKRIVGRNIHLFRRRQQLRFLSKTPPVLISAPQSPGLRAESFLFSCVELLLIASQCV